MTAWWALPLQIPTPNPLRKGGGLKAFKFTQSVEFKAMAWIRQAVNRVKIKFSPEVILGYIYAVLYHKNYRETFLDFLKIDSPKIPFVENKKKLFDFK